MRDMGLIPGWGRSPGGGRGNPLQYSFLENPMDREVWRATAHSVPKSQARLKSLNMHTPTPYNHSLQPSSPCLGVCFSASCSPPNAHIPPPQIYNSTSSQWFFQINHGLLIPKGWSRPFFSFHSRTLAGILHFFYIWYFWHCWMLRQQTKWQ